MSKKMILSCGLASLLLVALPAPAAKLPDLRHHPIVERVTALRKPMTDLVRTCQNMLGRLLVRFPIDIEIRTNGSVLKGQGDLSSLLTPAKYTQEELTRDRWAQTIESDGVRELRLSRAFPESIVVQVERASAPFVPLIEGPAAPSGGALVPVNAGVPAVLTPGQIFFEAEIVADPENVSRLDAFRGGFQIERKGEVCTISQRKEFSYAVKRNEDGTGRFGGIGVYRAVVHLTERDADVLVFRDGTLVHGKLGPMPVGYVARKLRALSFDEERVEMLRNFVGTMPDARTISAAELAKLVGAMAFSDGELDVVRLVKARMSDRERREAAIAAKRFMTFDSDAEDAVGILLRD